MFILPESLFRLNLAFNKITRIKIKNNPLRIHFINLSHNLITEITTKTFFHLYYLKVIFLDYNNIRWIREKAFFSCRRLEYIRMNSVPPELVLYSNSYQNVPKLKRIIINDVNRKH